MRYIDMFPSTDSRGYVSENGHTQVTFILSSRPMLSAWQWYQRWTI